MGLSTHIIALTSDTNPEYRKHRKVLLACHYAGVSLPVETAEFFGSSESDTELLHEKLELELQEGVHYTPISGGGANGFIVNLKTLPSTVDKIKFINQW